MKRTSSDAMLTAAEWLDVNEGELGEMEDCRAVAEWLREQAQAGDLRAAAREHGVPVAELRRKLFINEHTKRSALRRLPHETGSNPLPPKAE